MQETVSQAKAEYTRAKDRLAKVLNETPEDKQNWSPSSTCRTPVEVAAHAVMSVGHIQGMLQGKPIPAGSPVELDSMSRSAEKKFRSKEDVLSLLDQNSLAFLEFLDSLTPEQLASTIKTPFGDFPVVLGITFPADHLRGHASQIEYIQTIYGDLDWHMG